MGLDQFAFSRDKRVFNDEPNELCSWRKHPYLQGWMTDLYEQKGGDDVLNEEELELTLEDIHKLKKDITEGNLPETTGYFFGSNSSNEYKEDDLKFCETAMKEIREGKSVFYWSWW